MRFIWLKTSCQINETTEKLASGFTTSAYGAISIHNLFRTRYKNLFHLMNGEEKIDVQIKNNRINNKKVTMSYLKY